MRIGSVCLLVGCLFAVSGSQAQGEDWPQFRGPALSGRSPDTSLPTKWSDTHNIAWKARLPGDVSNTHVLWKNNEYSPMPTPVLVEGKLYRLNDSGFAFCVDAAIGQQIYRKRPLGGGAGGNRSTYGSMVEANGKLYALSRTAGTYVITGGSEYDQLACNSFASDKTDFHGTPAISNGRLFLRSNTHLYCVQASK